MSRSSSITTTTMKTQNRTDLRMTPPLPDRLLPIGAASQTTAGWVSLPCQGPRTHRERDRHDQVAAATHRDRWRGGAADRGGAGRFGGTSVPPVAQSVRADDDRAVR